MDILKSGDLLAEKASPVVKQVKIISSFSGRVEEIVMEEKESVTFWKARTVLGLESQLYTVRSEPEAQLWVASVDNDLQKKESFPELAGKWVINGHNIKSRLSGNRFSVLGDGVQDYIPYASLVFEGRGRGHGVGMSQYGAYNRSRAGQSYREILSFYYPGTDVVAR